MQPSNPPPMSCAGTHYIQQRPPQQNPQPIPTVQSHMQYAYHQPPTYVPINPHQLPMGFMPPQHPQYPHYPQYQMQQQQHTQYQPQQVVLNPQGQRRPPYRPTGPPEVPANVPTYNANCQQQNIEALKYQQCGSDVTQSPAQPYQIKPVPIPIHNIPPQQNQHHMQHIRPPLFYLPHMDPRITAAPMQHMPHYAQLQQHYPHMTGHHPTILYPGSLVRQEASHRPGSVSCQEYNTYRTMNHDNNLNRSSDNESHPGKESVPPKDPVNVRPASIPTPPQHSSTTSVASLVSEVISHPPKSVCGAPTDMCETEEKETKKEQPVKAESVPCSAKTKKEEKELNNSENTNSKGTQWCPLCQSNKRPENEYRSHCLRDNTNRATCPILRERTCRLCNATGDSAHNEFFCPTNVSEQGERLSANSTAEIEQSLQQLRLATENEDNKHAKTTSDVAESEPVDTEPEHVSVTESEQGSVKAASSIVPPSSSMITTTEPHPKMEFTQKVWVNSAYQKKSQYNRSRGGHHKNAENNGSTSQHKTKEHNSSSGTDNNASRRRRGGHRNAQKSTPTTTTKNTSNQ